MSERFVARCVRDTSTANCRNACEAKPYFSYYVKSRNSSRCSCIIIIRNFLCLWFPSALRAGGARRERAVALVLSTYGLLAITGAWAAGGAQTSATRASATGEIVMKKVLSLLQPAKSITRPVNERLDLSFAVNENDLRHILTTHVPAEPDEAGLQHLCRILCCVTERPSALSIAHDGADTPLLSIIMAYMAHATGLLSATADLAENMRASDCTVLLWRDCGNAVALLHAATRLFVQLVATPQYRFLLLQHELPTHVHRALARLADCVHLVLAAAAGDAGKLDGREAVDAGSHSQVDISNEPPLWAVMSTVQSCVLLLGSSWQAGFGALHAPEGLLRPTLSRLSDSVEALLRAPPTMQESLLPASTAGANTGSGISCGASCTGGGGSSSAGFNDGSSGPAVALAFLRWAA